LQQFLGWCVHGYTALGLLAAWVIAVLLVEGSPGAFRWAFLLMVAATAVDATDGTLARRVRIKEAVPSFDGRRLDDIIDFLTYTFLPLLLVWRAGILPQGFEPWLLLPLVASIYGFCQVHAKTEDGYFLGFPSLWNVVALYLYALPFGPRTSLLIVVVLAILTFVPSRYLYPSLPGAFNRVMTILAIPWAISLVVIIWNLPDGSVTSRIDLNTLPAARVSLVWNFLEDSSASRLDPTMLRVAWASLIYPMFYLGASWVISLVYWLKPRPAAPDRVR
jgi:phosphatidylcholine synthase